MSTLEFNESLISLEKYLKLFAFSFTKNSDEAADLTQETFLTALRYQSKYTPQTNFKAWVFTIMRNIFINQYRRNKKARTIFDYSKESENLASFHVEKDSTFNYMIEKDLKNQIEKLEEEYKRPFHMHFEGFKYHEIAETLKLPIGTVKSRIFIARKKMASLIPEQTYLVS